MVAIQLRLGNVKFWLMDSKGCFDALGLGMYEATSTSLKMYYGLCLDKEFDNLKLGLSFVIWRFVKDHDMRFTRVI